MTSAAADNMLRISTTGLGAAPMVTIESSQTPALPGNTALSQSTAKSRRYLAIFLFFVFLPIAKEIGGLLLSPTRVFLLIATIPFAVQCLTGKYGRVTIVDILMSLHGLWIFVSLIANHGASVVPFAGITTVELAGGYFVGRALVRDADDYRYIFKFILIGLIILLPFSIVENLTAKIIIPDLLRPVFDTHTRARSADGRLGLERVQSVFDHPILWGMFCSLTISNYMKCLRGPMVWRLLFVALSIWLTFSSLSSGPLLAIGLQTALLLWGWITKDRWLLCAILAALAFIAVDIASDRGPIKLLISYATFNKGSAWTRIIQFEWGMRNLQGNMLFGIGLRDWIRPAWLTGASVDNFWLLTAMRYGATAFFTIFGAFIVHVIIGAYAKISDPEIRKIRIGHMIALVALILISVTVHIWGNMSIFAMFYLGAGAWLYTTPLDKGPDPETVGETTGAERGPNPLLGSQSQKGPVYSRFAQTKTRAGLQDADVKNARATPPKTGRNSDTPEPRKHADSSASAPNQRNKPKNLWARDLKGDAPHRR